MKNLFIILLFICSSLSLCFANNYVPVFMWSNDRDREFPQVFAGHFTSKFDFQSKYISKTSDTILLFIQDELSLSDILLHGSVYGESSAENDYDHLKSIMSEYTSSFLPHVEYPALAISQIFENDDSFNVIQIDVKDLQQKGISDSIFSTSFDKNLFIIDFSRGEQTLQNIDELMGNIVSHMKQSNRLFTAYYTANENDEVDSSMDSSSSMSRHLLAIDSPTDQPSPISNGNFLFYFDELWIDKTKNLSVSLKEVNVVENGCNLYTNVTYAIDCTIKLKLGDTDPYKDINLELLIQTSAMTNVGYWYVKNAILSYDNSVNGSASEGPVRASVGRNLLDPTPIGYSYSCYEQEPLIPSKSANYTYENVPTLVFVGLQFEVFMSNNKMFGHYNDCVGFFTIGIWMFIICAAILITILLFGVAMLMSINTMDRYDDPKAKTISITAGE